MMSEKLITGLILFNLIIGGAIGLLVCIMNGLNCVC